MDPSKDRWTGDRVVQGGAKHCEHYEDGWGCSAQTLDGRGAWFARSFLGLWGRGTGSRIVLRDKNRTEAKGFRFPAGMCQRQILPHSKDGRRNRSVLSDISLDLK